MKRQADGELLWGVIVVKDRNRMSRKLQFRVNFDIARWSISSWTWLDSTPSHPLQILITYLKSLLSLMLNPISLAHHKAC